MMIWRRLTQAALAMWLGQGMVWAQGAAPSRVVSLLPSTTELVCQLGACDRLVGVDRHTNHPPAVRALPRLGSMGSWSLEALVRLRPDLVLIPRDPQLAQRLTALGVTHRVVDPQNLDDVRRSFDEVATAVGLPSQRGHQLWQALQLDLQRLRESLPPSTRGVSVYLEVDSAGYVAGPSSHLGELVQALGWVNAVTLEKPAYPQLSPEWVLRRQPSWVMLLSASPSPPAQRPGWSQLRALQSGQVCRFSPIEVDVLVRPGPRLTEAARLLVGCVQGERRG